MRYGAIFGLPEVFWIGRRDLPPNCQPPRLVIANRDEHGRGTVLVLRLDPFLHVLYRALVRENVVDVANRIVVVPAAAGRVQELAYIEGD